MKNENMHLICSNAAYVPSVPTGRDVACGEMKLIVYTRPSGVFGKERRGKGMKQQGKGNSVGGKRQVRSKLTQNASKSPVKCKFSPRGRQVLQNAKKWSKSFFLTSGDTCISKRMAVHVRNHTCVQMYKRCAN